LVRTKNCKDTGDFMKTQKLKHILPLLILILTLLAAGCQPGTPALAPTVGAAQDFPTLAAPAAVETSSEQPAPTSAPVNDPLANCPKEEPGKSLYVSELNGFCFLYPAGFTLEPDELRPNEVIKLVGPTEPEKPKSMERATTYLFVASNGAAGDLADSAAYVQKWRDLNQAELEYTDLTEQAAVIGGQPAVVLAGLPGMIRQQRGYVISNGYKYSLTVSPQPGFTPDLEESISLVWDTVTASIVFFPPLLPRETVRAEDVCPQAAQDTQLYINELEGYCFLFPQDFEPVPDFNGRLVGGPNLGNWQGFENIQAALTVGSYPMLAGEVFDNPRDILAPRSDIDPASVEDRTIGGARAVFYMHQPQVGPWTSRQIIAVKNERVYTILSDPWEPERWPEAVPYLENVWETVTSSIRFFTPWN
jgi:hypothetical protein